MIVLNHMSAISFMSKYIIDANVLISAHRSKYPMDIFPSFWDNLLEQFNLGNIVLIDSVYDELMANEDDLSQWISVNEDYITVLESDDEDLIDYYSAVIQSVYDDNNYKVSAMEEFASVADSWIVAHAKYRKYIVVTEETFERNIKRKVKIPNECLRNNVQFIKTIDLLRALNIIIN